MNKLEQNQNFGQLVLQLIATKSYDLHIRFAASLLFKNFVRRNWMVCCNKIGVWSKEKDFPIDHLNGHCDINTTFLISLFYALD